MPLQPVERTTRISGGAIPDFDRPATALPRLAMRGWCSPSMPIGARNRPARVRFARDIVVARQTHVPKQSLRLYAVEPTWTLTGALADHRLALRPELMGNIVLEIARALGASVPQLVGPPEVEQFAKAAAADLMAQRGAALLWPARASRASARAVPLDQQRARRAGRFDRSGRSAPCRQRQVAAWPSRRRP